MPLYLLEFPSAASSREALGPLFEDVSRRVSASGGEVIEIQVTADLQRAFVVAEHPSQAELALGLRGSQAPLQDIAEVRLVGAEVADIKTARRGANYLVEWDFPPELTMDRYLARKREKAPLYANVPEVTFLRTYVREDMGKCLCFYAAPDKAAIRRARDVVSTPITRLHSLAAGRPTTADLFLDPGLQAQMHAFFEPRAAAVDAGQATIREGIAFLSRQVLPHPPARRASECGLASRRRDDCDDCLVGYEYSLFALVPPDGPGIRRAGARSVPARRGPEAAVQRRMAGVDRASLRDGALCEWRTLANDLAARGREDCTQRSSPLGLQSFRPGLFPGRRRGAHRDRGSGRGRDSR